MITQPYSRHYVKIFHNSPTLLQEMLVLRTQGWSLRALATKYSVDHSTIRKQCMDHGIPVIVHITYIHRTAGTGSTGIPKVKPKTYRDYLLESVARHPEDTYYKYLAKDSLYRMYG